MDDDTKTRTERLTQTSIVYRRLKGLEVTGGQPGPAGAEPATAAPPAPERHRPAPPRDSFVRRLFTRRPDRREVVLLTVVAAALLYSALSA